MLIEGENQVSWQEIAAEEMFFRSLKKVTDDANARVVLHRFYTKKGWLTRSKLISKSLLILLQLY